MELYVVMHGNIFYLPDAKVANKDQIAGWQKNEHPVAITFFRGQDKRVRHITVMVFDDEGVDVHGGTCEDVLFSTGLKNLDRKHCAVMDANTLWEMIDKNQTT